MTKDEVDQIPDSSQSLSFFSSMEIFWSCRRKRSTKFPFVNISAMGCVSVSGLLLSPAPVLGSSVFSPADSLAASWLTWAQSHLVEDLLQAQSSVCINIQYLPFTRKHSNNNLSLVEILTWPWKHHCMMFVENLDQKNHHHHHFGRLLPEILTKNKI